MRRVATPSSSGNGSLSSRDRPSLEQQQQQHQHQQQEHFVHGPWNRKSITAILSQQQQHCYGSKHDNNSHGGSDPSSSSSSSATTADSPTHAAVAYSHFSSSEPSYSLLDLVSVGVGGTVGSGIFVLTGYINNHYAGPATFLSFAVSGLAALCSGISFAEFSGKLPRIEGSTYTYVYVSMGEYAAVLAASCLTLEYGVSGAAVARSWGDKVLEWMAKSGVGDDEVDHSGQAEQFFNPLAGLISLLAVVVLACGVQESKTVTNFFTVTKMGLVAFMIVGGFCLFRADNMDPLVVPAQMSSVSSNGPAFGVAGILRGATSSFFGYLGFDEVVCLAAEAKNPSDTPKAVLWTLAVVTIVYILASIALSGMLPYQDISDTSGFPNAFASRGITWAANLTAFGEVFTLPVVVLISLLAQPRLCAAMAKDGLLPAIFAHQTETDGNLWWSNLLCGIPMTLLATFVPFSWMDDAISVGILFAFNMTNTALIIMRCSSNSGVSGGNTNSNTISDSVRDAVLPTDQDVVVAVDEANGIVSSSYIKHPHRWGRWSLANHLFCYHFVALMAGLSSHFTVSTTLPSSDITGETKIVSTPWWNAQIGAAGVTLVYASWLHRRFPTNGGFGDNDSNLLQRSRHDSNADVRSTIHESAANATTGDSDNDYVFEVPLCPLLPLVGVYLNWYLISQLEWSGMVLLLVFLAIISMLYGFCISGSQINTTSEQQRYSPIPNPSDGRAAEMPPAAVSAAADGPILLREMSLPRRAVT